MTEPQDKAAIASLQASVNDILAALNTINTRLASLQRTAINLETNISALQTITRDGSIGPYGDGDYSSISAT